LFEQDPSNSSKTTASITTGAEQVDAAVTLSDPAAPDGTTTLAEDTAIRAAEASNVPGEQSESGIDSRGIDVNLDLQLDLGALLDDIVV
jgi:hypothetical protein